MQQGFILKADGDCVVFAGGEDLSKINDLAVNLFKAVELATMIAADGGLAAFDDPGLGERREPSSPFEFGFG